MSPRAAAARARHPSGERDHNDVTEWKANDKLVANQGHGGKLLTVMGGAMIHAQLVRPNGYALVSHFIGSGAHVSMSGGGQS